MYRPDRGRRLSRALVSAVIGLSLTATAASAACLKDTNPAPCAPISLRAAGTLRVSAAVGGCHWNSPTTYPLSVKVSLTGPGYRKVLADIGGSIFDGRQVLPTTRIKVPRAGTYRLTVTTTGSYTGAMADCFTNSSAVTTKVSAPKATPRPTPKPTPRRTPKPTPKTTPVPTPTATVSPRSSAIALASMLPSPSQSEATAVVPQGVDAQLDTTSGILGIPRWAGAVLLAASAIGLVVLVFFSRRPRRGT